MAKEQRERLHQMIAGFADYSIDSIAPRVDSAQAVLKHFPHDVTNPVLVFLHDNAMLGVLESLLNKLVQAPDLLDKGLRDLSGTGLQRTGEIRDVLGAG